MNRISAIALLFLLAVAGCKHPTEVVVQPPPNGQGEQLEVTPMTVADTSVYQGQLDSAAVTPSDQTQYAGLFLLSHATFDAGGGMAISRAYSRVVLTDRTRPLEYGGKVFGFWGRSLNRLRLGMVVLTLNGMPMDSIAHFIRVGGYSIPWGIEYAAILGTSLEHDSMYTWRASAGMFGAIDISIKAPPALAVLSPQGGVIYSRNEDMKLRWDGQGNIVMYLSIVDPMTQRSKPLLKVRPLVNRGSAVLPAKVLRALPRGEYVFTFAVVNRTENAPVLGYGDPILAQASSVYNTYVGLR